MVRRFSRDFPLEGDAALLDRVKSGYLIYKELFPLPPGEYRLETAVLDRGPMAVGIRRNAFTIARPPALASALRSWCAAISPSASGNSTPPSPFNIRAAVSRHRSPPLARGQDQFSVFFLIYPDPNLFASTGPPRIPHGRRGVRCLRPATRGPDASGRIPAMVTASSAELSPGQYDVRVTVRQGSEHSYPHHRPLGGVINKAKLRCSGCSRSNGHSGRRGETLCARL